MKGSSFRRRLLSRSFKTLRLESRPVNMHHLGYMTGIMVHSSTLIRPTTLEFACCAAPDAPLHYPRNTAYLLYCTINPQGCYKEHSSQQMLNSHSQQLTFLRFAGIQRRLHHLQCRRDRGRVTLTTHYLSRPSTAVLEPFLCNI